MLGGFFNSANLFSTIEFISVEVGEDFVGYFLESSLIIRFGLV
jgi:hypothetical protein